MIKRIIPLFVALAFLLSVSVSAADVTEQGSDQTEVSDLVFDEGSVVSTENLPITDGEYSVTPLAETSSVITYSTMTETDWLSSIYNVLYQPQSSDGVSYSIYGLLMQVWYNSLESNTWLNNIYQRLNIGVDLLSFIRSYLFSSNSFYLTREGNIGSLTSGAAFVDLFVHASVGLAVILRENISVVTTMDSNTQQGFSRLVAVFTDLIVGSETDNTYSGSITSNDNAETEFSAVGLGPMLNTWLAAIEKDLGQLAYMYADDDQLAQKTQEKEEAEQAKEEIAEKSDQMDSLVEDMNSVNKPDVNSVVPDVNIVVSDNDISVISDSLAPWFQQSLFLNYLLIVCMLMFVSYVLFGKKG